MHNICLILAILLLLCSYVQPQAMPSPTPNSGSPERELSPGVGMACVKGPTGSFAESSGSFWCSVCTLGYFQPSPGQSTCIAAPMGSYVPGVGQISFQQCPVGTFNDKKGQSSSAACRPCPAGSFSSQIGATVCRPCAAGSFSSQAGATGCSQCPAGKSSSAGSTECTTSCSDFQYVNAGSGDCRDCPHKGLAKSDRLSCYRKVPIINCTYPEEKCNYAIDSNRTGTAWVSRNNGLKWWSGDISPPTNIKKVVLWRRMDRSPEELVDILVSAHSNSRQSFRGTVYCEAVTSADKPYVIFDCSHQAVKLITIRKYRNPAAPISLTEVEVYAD